MKKINLRYDILVVSFLLLSLTACQKPAPKSEASPVTGKTINSNISVSATTSDALPKDTETVKEPIKDASSRVTKKPFGLKVSPSNSPVQPERFSGYHTGVDFETFSGEADSVVAIKAACSGTVIYKQRVSGYGGVFIQSCELETKPVTVLYGHLAISSISLKIGDKVAAGELIGNLGQGFSAETDGERKHLHLGIHQGKNIDLRGYVQKPEELSQWLDITKLLLNS
ncbi:MAG: M23 family metallopeptidase [Patescibacteria group bacterium]|jgi:murein DD-endopeptidase MepM/ murein hydrolase activator NlpD